MHAFLKSSMTYLVASLFAFSTFMFIAPSSALAAGKSQQTSVQAKQSKKKVKKSKKKKSKKAKQQASNAQQKQ